MPFVATWMALQNIILSKVSQKDNCHMMSHTCGIYDTNEPVRQKQTHRQNRRVVAEGEGREGVDWEFAIRRCKLV